MHPWYDGYWWQWTVQNILPNPLIWLLAAGGVWLFRKRIEKLARWWNSHADNGWRDEMDALRQHVTRQAAESHAAMLKSVERRHQEVLDRVDVQHEALKAHITAAAAPASAAAERIVPAKPATSRKGTTHG